MHRILLAGVFLAAVSLYVTADDNSEVTTGADLSFRLPGINGSSVELTKSAPSDLTVVCFLQTECPLARLYARRLPSIVASPEAKGVRFIGINSNQQDSIADIEAFVAEFGILFPFGKDYGIEVADRYGVIRTPKVFLLDGDLNVLYRGRIDDQYLPGRTRPEPQRQDLLIALQEVKEGKPVSLPRTEPQGCLIGRIREPVTDSNITFTNQVSRILNANCVECHRKGEIGPFELTDYDEVIGWADMMLETIDDGRMPPWHADPAHGEFTNARRMSEEDKQTLRDWVAAGTPYGDVKELPEPPQFTTGGWDLPREPDVVYEMRDRPFSIPSDGTVEYQYYVSDPGFEEDMWVTGAQIIPGERGVVHHSIVYIRPPDGSRFRGVGWLSAYVPGQRTLLLPEGYARRIPKGSKLVFQMHYTPNGEQSNDLSKVGLIFTERENVTHEVYTTVAVDQEFEIPPGNPAFSVDAEVGFIPSQGELLAFSPHMHLRGSAMQIYGVKDGKRETLLDVPQYDFNWQHIYELEKPLSLANFDEVEITATFDNSKENPVNPDPGAHVTWGEQSWEEMTLCFFEIAVPLDAEPAKAELTEDERAKRQVKIDAFVQEFIEKFDLNGDGEVERDETPLALEKFGFWRLDKDHDRRLTKSELEDLARHKLDFETE
ncbi:MAG: redoxin domain-containing protein [Planctomycetaceae bacterium]|nr:redoxin domain-containing protein [Planctomycetaceae bacterium]